jgi:hypothetical protein
MNQTPKNETSEAVSEEVRAFLSRIGSVKSKKKTATAREQIPIARAAKHAKWIEDGGSACTCGRAVTDALSHKSTCRVYQAEYARRRRAKESSDGEIPASVPETSARPKGRPKKAAGA